MADTVSSSGVESGVVPSLELRGAARRGTRFGAGRYLLIVALLALLGSGAVVYGNLRLAPLLHDTATLQQVGRGLAAGQPYGNFDLNVEIRALRDAQIAALPEAPEVAVLGASHWQEGHVSLLPDHDFLNAHVHRDYWEDILGVTEMFVRHDRLPRKMIISIRDNQFTPAFERTDFLWVPTLPWYRAMAERLGLPVDPSLRLIELSQLRELLSLPLLLENLERQLAAQELPGPREARHYQGLDVLLPGGSILWSGDHQAIFTAERARDEALGFAAQKRNSPPQFDAAGVEAVDRLLGFLVERGVEVTLAHPPFNPIFYDAVAGSPYEQGLHEVEALARRLADKHGLEIIGSFDPRAVGCDSSMYIDAEHSNPECLGKVLGHFARIDAARR